MLRVGLTGGIGSGKSTVARIFDTLGVPIYLSDDRAKEIMHENEGVRERIRVLFGPESYHEEGLNRAFIAQKVFADRSLLEQLNGIVHPAVGLDFEEWCKKYSDHPYILKEAAIIFEAGLYKAMDYTILVVAPEQVRIDRVMQRDQVTREEVLSRIKSQWPDAKKVPLANFVLINDGDTSLLRQVMEIHNFLCESDPK